MLNIGLSEISFQIYHRFSELYTSKMATSNPEGEGTSIDIQEGEVFHDINQHNKGSLSILMSVTQGRDQPLPRQQFSASVVAGLVKNLLGLNPEEVVVLNDRDVILECGDAVVATEVARALHGSLNWNGLGVQSKCLLTRRESAERISKDREKGRRRIEELESAHKLIGDELDQRDQKFEQLLLNFGSEVRKVEKLQQQLNPKELSHIKKHSVLCSPPDLPFFSGTEPVPRDEGSYAQWLFQVRGAMTSHTEEAVRSAIVTSVRGEAREVVEFVGLRTELKDMLAYIEERFGQTLSTDQLQKDWYQLRQERNEKLNQFAGRLENRYKKLARILPSRYNRSELKDRLFYGMHQQLRDSTRYVYETTGITYEELLVKAKKVEEEIQEGRLAARLKAEVDPARTELGELKKGIEQLTTVMQANTYNGARPKIPQNKNGDGRKNDDQKSKGMPSTAAGPFRNRQRIVQCYNCGGWGHFSRECPSPENLDWRAAARAATHPPGKGAAQPKTPNKTPPQ